MEVILVVCVILGQPGVGKSHLKYLLLDQRPPHLQNSTICAETPAGARLPTLNPAPKKKAAGATPALSDACQKAVNGIMDKLVQRITSLKSEAGQDVSPSPLSSILRSKWVYFTDSGGQPQYHELLPLFVRHISSALCVTRLTDQLDEIQEVEYYQKGKQVGESQQSQLSTKDTIQCLVNTIQSCSAQTSLQGSSSLELTSISWKTQLNLSLIHI